MLGRFPQLVRLVVCCAFQNPQMLISRIVLTTKKLRNTLGVLVLSLGKRRGWWHPRAACLFLVDKLLRVIHTILGQPPSRSSMTRAASRCIAGVTWL